MSSQEIYGVEFKSLVTHPDERGFFRELVRDTDDFFKAGFAQWSHSKMAKHTVKAWHFHHKQTDWWYVPIGVAQVVLYDNREESPTFSTKLDFVLGEKELNNAALSSIVSIPPGVLHSCKVLSEFAHLFYITSQTYDPKDEGRFAYNSGPAEHNWGNDSDIIVCEKDKKDFIPPHPRAKLDKIAEENK